MSEEEKEKTIAEILEEYLEDKELLLESIELPDEKTLHDIKADYPQLAEFYIKCFNEFRRVFITCKIPMIPEYIVIHQKIFDELLELSKYKNSKIEFGKSRKIKLLESYVVSNYTNISDFVDFYKEIEE